MVFTGCLDILSTKMKEYNSSLELVYDKICSNIYNQLQLVERIHPIKRIDADLMMEQSVVCGLLGYYEFLTPKRLKNVLDWQRPSGCYGNIEDEEDFSSQCSRQTMRKLLMKKELSGEILTFFFPREPTTKNKRIQRNRVFQNIGEQTALWK